MTMRQIDSLQLQQFCQICHSWGVVNICDQSCSLRSLYFLCSMLIQIQSMRPAAVVSGCTSSARLLSLTPRLQGSISEDDNWTDDSAANLDNYSLTERWRHEHCVTRSRDVHTRSRRHASVHMRESTCTAATPTEEHNAWNNVVYFS